MSHEFSLYRTLCTWLYLQANRVQQSPPFGTIVTYFNRYVSSDTFYSRCLSLILPTPIDYFALWSENEHFRGLTQFSPPVGGDSILTKHARSNIIVKIAKFLSSRKNVILWSIVVFSCHLISCRRWYFHKSRR